MRVQFGPGPVVFSPGPVLFGPGPLLVQGVGFLQIVRGGGEKKTKIISMDFSAAGLGVAIGEFF